MFNSEIKKRYIQYKESTTKVNPYLFDNLFRTTEPFEVQYDKDVSNFTIEEIEDMLKVLNFYSINSLDVFKSNLAIYTDWCVNEYLVNDNQNHYREITYADLPRFYNSNVARKKVVTREQVLDCCRQVPNAMDAFIILGFFEGIGGHDHCDFFNLTGRDINLDDKTINLANRGRLHVSLELCSFGIMAAEANEYYAMGEDATRTFKLEDSDKIIKDFPNVKPVVDEFRLGRRIYQKLKRALQYVDLEYMTAKDLQNSGMIEMIIKRSKELGVTTDEYLKNAKLKEEVAIQYGVTTSSLRTRLMKTLIDQEE